MNHFSLFCKSCLVLFLTLIMALQFYAAPCTTTDLGIFGTVFRIFGVAFVRALIAAGQVWCYL